MWWFFVKWPKLMVVLGGLGKTARASQEDSVV